LKNVQLGYTFPKSVTNKLFSRLRVYLQVKNAFILTEYPGFDPEIAGGILDTGIDRGAYPQARTYAFGVDIKL
jgi:TonB-dependent starch-binding outer membrane protein SusC